MQGTRIRHSPGMARQDLGDGDGLRPDQDVSMQIRTGLVEPWPGRALLRQSWRPGSYGTTGAGTEVGSCAMGRGEGRLGRDS